MPAAFCNFVLTKQHTEGVFRGCVIVVGWLVGFVGLVGWVGWVGFYIIYIHTHAHAKKHQKQTR